MDIYLASPYTHPDLLTRMARYDAACAYLMGLIAAGVEVFSPIVYFHPLNLHPDFRDKDHAFWIARCMPYLLSARELHILALRGWEESKGIEIEMEQATHKGIPITLVYPD